VVHVTQLSVTLMGPPSSLAATARRFEEAGADAVWTGDYFQSGLVRAAVIATATQHAQVGIHVLQAFARSPLATALAAQELQALSGGRFVLGLGSQVPAANRRWHGVQQPKPVRALADYVGAVRALFSTPADETCTYRGPFFAFDVPPFRSPRPPGPPTAWPGTCCGVTSTSRLGSGRCCRGRSSR
jgi:alkanesulfonate monooxygenase SsuD/methylene tetrahydromethanopterin reductase-like flavin-dependent oxidoreductase (luciferase family)